MTPGESRSGQALVDWSQRWSLRALSLLWLGWAIHFYGVISESEGRDLGEWNGPVVTAGFVVLAVLWCAFALWAQIRLNAAACYAATAAGAVAIVFLTTPEEDPVFWWLFVTLSVVCAGRAIWEQVDASRQGDPDRRPGRRSPTEEHSPSVGVDPQHTADEHHHRSDRPHH